MPHLLDLPLELRNHVFEILLAEPLERRPRAVMLTNERFVTYDIPLRNYRGLLSACQQTHREVKKAIQFLVTTKRLNYFMNMAYSHKVPYPTLTWLHFPALSPTINHICINVDLADSPQLRHHHDFLDYALLNGTTSNFALRTLNYVAELLKSLATILKHGNPNFRLLYTECLTVNLRTPTRLRHEWSLPPLMHFPPTAVSNPIPQAPLYGSEREYMMEIIKDTLKEEQTKCFSSMDAGVASELYPLIQFGKLQFASEGEVWAEGHNFVLNVEKGVFCWLKYASDE